MIIYFTRYDRGKSITILSLCYHELIGNMKEHEVKNYLMVEDYILDKVSDKIKQTIGIEKVDDTKILIDIDDKLPDDITSRNVVILMTRVKDVDKFYP